MPMLNGPQSRSILCGFLDVHRRMADLEALMNPGERTPFSQFVNDISPTEAKVVRDYFDRIRAAMLAHLRECEVPLEVRPTSLRWTMDCGISFMGITVGELRPSRLRGYGPLTQEAHAQSTKICEDLSRLVDQVSTYLRQGMGRDLDKRLSRLEEAQVGVGTITRLEKIITKWQLVEFRPTLEMIVSRLEASTFEIAVFGRVSSGKSSLLNHIAGIDALPVGVTPVTAVPTRLVSGDVPSVVVSLAESRPRSVELELLWEYASEEGNPGNNKHVTSILVKLPSPRLKEGIVFVDTPGVGSLALTGGAETIAYLPRCDLGVVLVDSASVLHQEDLAVLRALYAAAIPAMVLLSKAGLLAPGDRVKMTEYIREQVGRELALELPVHPVSTVGADESLLTAWFEKELTPQLDRHRSLAEASINRKIACLRESVVATLETLLANQRGRGLVNGARIDTTAAQQILDEADQAIRHERERSLTWLEDRRALVESVPGLVADVVVSSQERASESVIGGVIEEALRGRGREAHDIIASFQDALAGSLDMLSKVAPLAHADPSSIQTFHTGGLPAVNLARVPEDKPILRPWWAGIAPPLAVWATERVIRERFGGIIKEAVEFYDRQLESWAKAKNARLVELYEMQAGTFREQIRRLANEATYLGTAGGDGALESDLRDLRPLPIAPSR